MRDKYVAIVIVTCAVFWAIAAVSITYGIVNAPPKPVISSAMLFFDECKSSIPEVRIRCAELAFELFKQEQAECVRLQPNKDAIISGENNG